ncbi:Crp/Fnr family transcriptional regulator [Aureispira anguillae]|uniref:cAMP-binding domain of CRP or a regulatory subunit of cAMP-dependent protein kinases n=1 Tax=Aureispira anguillae TaxID=2864201 RepID=A0A915Y9H2_9BACT|nr:hypothetical protein [Aureispira anguillae]BDS09473.1 hypothetical protein AsAng_0001710 [Aureispira anguillae]
MEQLITYINQYMVISEALQRALLDCCCWESVPKGQLLIEEGKVCRKKWFIQKGLTKAFWVSPTGIPKIVGFHLENTWMTQLDSYEHGTASAIYLEAVEELEVLVLSKEDELKLLEYPDYVKLQYLLCKEELIKNYQIQRQINSLDGLERYRFLMEHFPALIHRAKLKDIASFIGISQERLSRIRKVIY